MRSPAKRRAWWVLVVTGVACASHSSDPASGGDGGGDAGAHATLDGSHVTKSSSARDASTRGSAVTKDAAGTNDAASTEDAPATKDAAPPNDAPITSQDSGQPGHHDSSTPPPPSGDGGSCLGASMLDKLGKSSLMVGGMVADATASSTPIDLRYIYLSGTLFDGTAPCASCATSCTSDGTSCANASGGCGWWGCWQYDQNPPGETVRDFVTAAKAATPAQIPMFTYYVILQASGATQGAGEVQAANDSTFMERYFADFRFMLQQIGQDKAIVHIEPDFWGFSEQVNPDAHSIPAAVASANPTDCASLESSIAGMGQCMISMAHHYAPNAMVGLSSSAWATNTDVSLNSSASLNVAAQAAEAATFLGACGASSGDFIVVETSDRDAGYYASIGQDHWWDATNATLPDFTQDLTWVKALTEALGVPGLYWQTPFGNTSLNNTTDHWQDNRVDYFFANMDQVAASHVVGIAYGAGTSGMTTAESDGGNFITKVEAYVSGGGQALCE